MDSTPNGKRILSSILLRSSDLSDSVKSKFNVSSVRKL